MIEKRIKLIKDDFTIHELGESFNHTFAYLEIYVDGSHNLTEIRELKAQILDDNKKVPKLELKLKMMEISFEQINNSRNNLIKQLADCEILNKELKEK